MIASRTEYDFVDIPSSIRINGGIMPLRPESARNELRGEDPAFLMEATAERAAVYGNSAASSKTAMTREIRGDRLQSVANAMRTDVADGRYIMPFPAGPVYDLRSLDLAAALNLHHSLSDLLSSPEDFARGRPLDQSKVMKLFADTDLLRNANMHFPNGPYFGTNVSFTHSYDHGEAGGASEDTWEGDGRNIYDYRASSYEMTDWDGTYWYGQWREATASGGSLSFGIGDVRKKYIHPVSRVVCICSVTNQWTDGDESHDNGSDDYAAFSCTSTYSDGTVTLNLSSLVSGAKSLLEHYGFSQKFRQINGSQSARVDLVSILPVVEMDDRCRW